jgi:hypothetical protein
LLSLLFATDDAEPLKARFGTRTPTHLVGGFLIGISLLFIFMWGGMSISSAAAGTRPEEILREVVIIDSTVLPPLLFFGGYVLGGLLLVKALATGSTLAFTTALGAWWAQATAPFDAFLFLFGLSSKAAELLLEVCLIYLI